MSHLKFFPENLGTVSNEHGDSFHQHISTMKKRYPGKQTPSMLFDYCWTKKRDTLGAKYALKSQFSTFYESQNEK